MSRQTSPVGTPATNDTSCGPSGESLVCAVAIADRASSGPRPAQVTQNRLGSGPIGRRRFETGFEQYGRRARQVNDLERSQGLVLVVVERQRAGPGRKLVPAGPVPDEGQLVRRR